MLGAGFRMEMLLFGLLVTFWRSVNIDLSLLLLGMSGLNCGGNAFIPSGLQLLRRGRMLGMRGVVV